MADYYVTYAFPDKTTSESGWDYVGPAGNNVQNKDTRGYWCWTDSSSYSFKTGPPTGTACVYSESSHPSQGGDVFTMTLSSAINASTYSLNLTFDVCLYGETTGVFVYVEAWNGSSWVEVDSFVNNNDQSFSGKGPYDFSGYGNSDFKIRFRVIVSSDIYYRSDMAFDNIRIYGDTRATTSTDDNAVMFAMNM